MISSLKLRNNVFLAPMAGVTDKAFRIIAREAGCALAFTEMVSAKALTYMNEKSHQLIDLSGEPKPVAVQIFGSEPEIMAKGAEIVVRAGADMVDINMGCPTPKIVKSGEGAALMRDVGLAVEIAQAVVEAVGVPVTVKMRKGWDDESINAVEMAKAVEKAGVTAVTVHGRTREQFYAGTADWEIIREVKQEVGIPVVGNGDVWCPQDAKEMLDYTGCDGVMIGRGARGNPWLLTRTLVFIREGKLIPEPTPLERLKVARRHLDLAVRFKGEKKGLLEMRKHLAWYIRGLPGAVRWREKINRTECIGALKELLREIEFEFT